MNLDGQGLLERIQADTHTPAIAAAVLGRDHATWHGEVGGIDQDTVFRAASVSKVLVATAMVQLVREGRVALDDPAVEHLRSWPLRQPPGTRPITIRDLLTHTSGIGELRAISDLWVRGGRLGVPDDGRPIPTLEEFNRKGLATKLPPGVAWAYANHGFSVLGQILADLDKAPFPEVMAERVLGPLGMHRSTYDPRQVPSDNVTRGHSVRRGNARPVTFKHLMTSPGGELYTTAGDLGRFARSLLAGSAELTARHYEWDPRLPMHQGLALVCDHWDGHLVAIHGGNWNGFRAYLAVAPDDGVAALALANATTEAAGRVGVTLIRRALGLPDRPPVPEAVGKPFPEGIAGVYGAPEGGGWTNARTVQFTGGAVALQGGDPPTLRAAVGVLRKPWALRRIDEDDPWRWAAVAPDGLRWFHVAARPAPSKRVVLVDDRFSSLGRRFRQSPAPYNKRVVLVGYAGQPLLLVRRPGWSRWAARVR